MQIISPDSYRALRSITTEESPRNYPASHSIERAFIVLCDTPDRTPEVRYVRVTVRAVETPSNNAVEVNVDCVDRFVRALADDPTVGTVLVDYTTVYTKPTCTGGVNEDALTDAISDAKAGV